MIVTELDQTEDVNYNTRKDKSKAESETDLFIRNLAHQHLPPEIKVCMVLPKS